VYRKQREKAFRRPSAAPETGQTQPSPSEAARSSNKDAMDRVRREFGNQDLEERLPRGYHFETDENGMTWTVGPDGDRVQGKQIPFGPGTEPVASQQPETIRAAATKIGEKIYTGVNHPEAWMSVPEEERAAFNERWANATPEEKEQMTQAGLSRIRGDLSRARKRLG